MTAEIAHPPGGPARNDIDQTCDDLVVIDLVASTTERRRTWRRRTLQSSVRPADTDGVSRPDRLADADADDVAQSVWLHLVNHLGKIREPAALAGWLATTTRRECGRLVRAAHGPRATVYALDAETMADEQSDTAEQEVLAAERHAALREAYTHLPTECQRLVSMLTSDPPLPFAGISARLAMPVGSIGPTRSRCLDRLRRYPAIAALINPRLTNRCRS